MSAGETLFVVMMLLGVLGCAVLFIRAFSEKLVDCIGLFGLLFILIFVVRPGAIFLLGYPPRPDFIPDFRGDVELLAQVELLALSCLAGVAAVLATVRSAGIFAKLFPHIDTPHANSEGIERALWIYWGLSALVVAYVLATAPSIARLILYVRLEKGLGDATLISEILPATLYLTVGYGLTMLQQQRMGRFWSAIIMFLLLGTYTALTGSRNSIVLPGIALTAGLWLYTGNWRASIFANKRPRKDIVMLGLAFCVPLALLFGLNLYRLMSVRGATITGDMLNLEEIMISMNMNLFDGFAGVAKLISNGLPLRDGEDFYLGFIGLIPRALWADKPEVINTGVTVAQLFIPTRVFGLPISSPGEWYYNFGWFGPFVGGVVTGFFLRAIQTRYRDWMLNAFSLVIGVQLIMDLIQLGFSNTLARRYFVIVVPIFLFNVMAKWLQPKARPRPAFRGAFA